MLDRAFSERIHMASRLERLVSIDAYIRGGSFPSVEKLCQLFEMQPRTIYQDLRELREMFGLDIRFDRTRNGYYNADPAKQLPPLAMTHDEAVLLMLAIDMLGKSIGSTIRGALARTINSLMSSDSDHFAWLSNVVSFESRADCEVKCSVLLAVLKAAAAGQYATLETNDPQACELTMKPTNIFYSSGHWHAMGYTEDKASIEIELCRVVEVMFRTA
jgi:predicted DNA-binding transcriptional regulator YafY